MNLWYNHKAILFAIPLVVEKTIRRYEPLNNYEEGKTMIGTVLISALVSGIVASIVSYKKGYKDGYEKGGWMSIDLC